MSEFIPLSHFLDRSDLMQPLGYQAADGSLCSAMRNPLYDNYNGKIAFEFRPRDNWGYNVGLDYEPRQGTLNENNFGDVDFEYVDMDGIRADQASLARLQTDFLSIYNSDDNRAIWLIAYKLNSIPTSVNSTWHFGEGASGIFRTSAHLSYFDGTAGRVVCWFRRYSTSPIAVFDNNLTDRDLDVYKEESVGKWILFQITKNNAANNHAFRCRALGGQFGSGSTPLEGVERTDQGAHEGNWSGNLIRVPLVREISVGLAAYAFYPDVNNADSEGLSADDIEWTIFDREHVCNAYTTSGNELTFQCQNKIAWEIFSDGKWVNTDGSSGANNRVFYDTGTHTVVTPEFTQIRPVLQNTGTLNADTQGRLLSLQVATADPRDSEILRVVQTDASTIQEKIKRDYVRLLVSAGSGHTETQWQIIEAHQTFAQPLIDLRSSNTNALRKNGNLLVLNKNELRIILRFNTSYKLRYRTKTNGIWSDWTVSSFRTRDKDYKYNRSQLQ